MMAELDVLVPTYRRPAALAVTLATLIGQTLPAFRVIVSDQTEPPGSLDTGEIQAVVRVLRATGRRVELLAHRPPRGLAEHRQWLLDRASARYALFLDDDVICEPDLLERLLRTIREEGCGFVGSAVMGLSHDADHRPLEEGIEFWDGPVQAERVEPGGPEWERHRLHNAANLYLLQRRLGLTAETQRVYHVAWVGGCVLYDVEALRACGGFAFWTELPPNHAGEDALAQLRVMARFGGCGVIPSGAYHQELETTVPDRAADAPWVLR